MQRAIVVFFLFIFTMDAIGQTLTVRPFPFAQQLFTNQVYKIYQEREGFIWIGTTSSLQRWDGYRLLTFRNNNLHPNLLTDNYIRDIADTPDLLWIVGNKGLTLYRKSTGHFFLPKDKRLVNKWISRVLSDGKDGLWLATGKELYHCNSDCSEIRVVNLWAHIKGTQATINDISLDNTGSLWIMCNEGSLIRRSPNGRFSSMPAIPNGGIACCIFRDDRGNFWVGTWGKGLWQLYPHGNGPHKAYWQQHHVKSISGKGEEDIFYCIRQDSTYGWLWMLSYNKIYIFDLRNGVLKPVDLSAYFSPLQYYTNMIVDKNQNVWLTAYDSGKIISLNNYGIINFQLPQISKFNDSYEEIPNLYSDNEYIWINRQRHGLLLMNKHTHQAIGFPKLNLPEMATMCPAIKPHCVWGALRYYAKAYKLCRYADVVTIIDSVNLETILHKQQPINNIIEVPNGALWMLTEHSLVARLSIPHRISVTADVLHPTAIAPVPHSFSCENDILCAAGRKLLLCTANENRIGCKELASLNFLYEGEEVLSMAAEPDGHLWIATTLARTFRSDNTMRYFYLSPIDSLLQDGLVQDMLATKGGIWVMNDKHIIQYSPKHAKIMCYNAGSENIMVKGFCHQALCTDGDGVLAGGIGGIVHLPNHIILPVIKHPSIFLTNLLVDGQSIFFDSENSSGSTFHHVILPADAHNIEIHLSTLSFNLSTNVRLQYRLSDIESKWTLIKAAMPTAHYNSLPRGKHTLQVRYSQSDGTWSQPIDIAVIERRPAWYESDNAFCCYIVLAGLSFLLLVRHVHVSHARQLQNKVKQAKVDIITKKHHLTDRIVSIINQHIADPEFGLEQILAEMNMSKTTLYRQLKDETDMTPADLIRSIRMRKAIQMLLEQTMSIAEVAYAIGFTSPKYFTRCFKNEFGQTPTEYIHTHTSKDATSKHKQQD